MDLHLRGKRALVTGSTSGIGFAAALGLAREGVSVIINGRTAERVNAAVDRIQREVVDALASGAAGDLSSARGVEHVTERVPEVDILVNNMGIFEPRPFGDITDEEWFRFYETNVMSGIRLSRHYLPGMLTRNWGRIVFISSESAVNIPTEMIHYGMTKTAQLAIARGMAELTTRTGVTVNSILPGPTKSEGVATFVERLSRERGIDTAAMEREFFQTARPTSLLQRFIAPEEVAHLIVYICSPRSSATNGAALRVDGGVVRSVF